MLLISFGTRPEYLKLKLVMDNFDNNNHSYCVLFTGQHSDLLPSEALSYVNMHLTIKDNPNRLDSIVASMMNNDEIFANIDYVLVQGDTTSTFAIALAAFHRKIKVIHLEAGLRTYDFENPYPEEMNRQLVSRIADIHLCPTELDKQHLLNEQVRGKIHVVGNTVLDSLLYLTPSYNNEVLITMHRRENHQIIPEWFDEFESLADANPDLKFTLLSHPNPNIQSHLHRLKMVEVIPPLSHKELIEKLKTCRFIITDSGGLQEESCFLNKKSIVCREKTERQAGVGIWSTLCPKPGDLKSIFNKIKIDYKPQSALVCPYGDGKSSQKIYNILKDVL